jgi:hypothetical protein
MKKDIFGILLTAFLLCSCGSNGNNSLESVSVPTSDAGSQVTSIDNDTDVSVDTSTSSGSYSPLADDIFINLQDNASTTSVATNVTISGNVITITAVGNYVISGLLTEGQIIVNAPKNGDIEDCVLTLNGVNITCSTAAPIYSKGKAKLQIEKAPGSINYICDNRDSATSATYTGDDNAAIFSDKKLKIFGTGKLSVLGNFNNGICSDKGIELKEGTLIIASYNHSIKAHEKIEIGGTLGEDEAGLFQLSSKTGSCIRSDSELELDEDTNDYYLTTITQGRFVLVSEYDGIEVDGYLSITGGNFEITCGGYGLANNGSNSSYTLTSDMPSRKGIKADQKLAIKGAVINIDSYDDAVYSNSDILVSGGTLNIACATKSKLSSDTGGMCGGGDNQYSGSDAIHSDLAVNISDTCLINVIKSYEGIEGTSVTISGGTSYVISSDDAVNAASDVSGANIFVLIEGGYLFVNALGDGIDSNGNIIINGGVMVVSGPTNDGNAALDCGDNGSYIEQNGGLLVAYGSSGMAVGPTQGSQYSFLLNHSSVVSSSSYYLICNDNDQVLYAIKPENKSSSSSYCYSLVFSSSQFADGTYKIKTSSNYQGGEEIFAQVYVNGTSNSATQLASITFSSSNKHVTSGSGNNHGGNRP